MPKLIIFAIVVSFSAVCSFGVSSTDGAVIAVEFGGYVTRADVAGNSGIQPEDRFTGVFRYDQQTDELESFPGQARYSAAWTESEPAFATTIRGITFALDRNVDLFLQVVNDQDLSFPEDPNAPQKIDVFAYAARGERLKGYISLADVDLDALTDTRLPGNFVLS